MRVKIGAGADRQDLQRLLAPGAARNALDCALWDLEAKRDGVRAWALAGLDRLDPVKTCYTISMGPTERKGETARDNARRSLLKVKIGAAEEQDAVGAGRGGGTTARTVEVVNADAGRGGVRSRLGRGQSK